MNLKIISVLFFSIGLIFAQNKNPDEILERVKNEFNKIEDYRAEVNVKVDIPFLKMPERNATLYYKKPDKIHIESEGFAMLPREGINFSPISLLESEYTSFYERNEKLGNVDAAVIKIIPLNGQSDVLLSTLWVDPGRNIILKAESSRKPSGTFSIEFDYELVDNKFNVPSVMKFSFTVDQSMFRSRMHDNSDLTQKEKSKDSANVKTGKVFIHYSNYKINKGIPDSLFDEKK